MQADGGAPEVVQNPTPACSATIGLDSTQISFVRYSFRLQEYAGINFKSLNQN